MCPNRLNKQFNDQRGQERQQQHPATIAATDMSKEIAAIKTQLLVIIGKLDRLEQEIKG
jgi:hypothetical protein